MTERRKLFSLIFIAFLVLVLPIALLLSRQRQEIRKKAYDVAGVQQHNLRVNKQTLPQGQTVDVYIEGDGQSYGYILGTLVYDTAYFEPVGVFSPVSSAHSFGAATSSIFRFGAMNKTALLSGQMLKLTLRAKQTGITNISIGQGVGVKLDGSSQNFTSTLGAATGVSVAITTSATSTPTPTSTVAANSAVISLGSATRSGNQISFPINFNASSTPYSGEFRVFFNSSELTYASVVKGNKTTTLNYYGTDTNGAVKNVNFGVTGFTAASGGAAVLNFTLNSGVQSASITIKNAEIPGLVYLKSSSAVKFPSISCAPSAGGNCIQTYSTITPSPTPTATPTTTPTATPGTGAVNITGLTHTLNTASNPLPNVTVSFNTNVQTLGSWVLTLPNGDKICPPGSSLTCVANREDFRHTTPATTHSFSAGSLVAGTYTYQVWAAITGGTPVSQTGTFTVTTSSTPSPTPTATVPAGNVAGDTNGNGCVGARDLAYVAGHVQTTSQCTPSRNPSAPTAAANGDFNNDGCVDDRDYSLVVELARLSCSE